MIRPAYLIAGALVLVAAGYVLVKKKGAAADAGAAVGSAAVNFVDGTVGAIVTQGAALAGIPKTNMTECQRAKAEGRTWDASFACPASDFLSYLWN